MINQNNGSRISTKEELYRSLNNYKGVLTKKVIGYLEALIDLEFSVIRDIDANTRNALSELEIYRKIAIYNIYNRALSIVDNSGIPYNVSDNECVDGLNIYYLDNEDRIDLFKFDYEQGFTYDKSNEFIKSRIGIISLYQTVNSKEQKDKEIERILKILERLYDINNPYIPVTHIQKYEEMLEVLNSKKEPTDKEAKEIEITNKIHEQLCSDYWLTDDDFEIGKSNSLRDDYDIYETEMKRTLVKTMPKLTIKNNIKYI